MTILTANISKMMTDTAHITTAIKYEIVYGLLISIFIFGLGLAVLTVNLADETSVAKYFGLLVLHVEAKKYII